MASDPRDLIALAQATQQTYAEVERLTSALGLGADATLKLLSLQRQLESASASEAEQFRVLSSSLGVSREQIEKLKQAQEQYKNKQKEGQKESKNFFQTIIEGATKASTAYFFIENALNRVAQAGSFAYGKLVQQNVLLQEQLLSTKASLVSTNKVMQQGIQIKDPTEAIKALNEPVNNAIARMRQGSLDLVGVTSSELVPVFQIVAQNASSIGASLDDAADLTLTFAASLGTIGIPLYQAGQEIRSILKGQIDQNSSLAKNVGLTNDMVNKWKAQGTLVENLTKKLEAFRAGNALAAQTINGVSSNIQEVIDEITRIAGEPLIKPIVTQLDQVYQYLKANQKEIGGLVQNVVNFFLKIGTELGGAFEALQPTIATLAKALYDLLNAIATGGAGAIDILVNGFVGLVQVASPFLQILGNIIAAIASLANNPVGALVIQAGILFGIVTTLLPAITAVGAAIGYLTIATGFAAASFTAAGGGIAGLTAFFGFYTSAAIGAAGATDLVSKAMIFLQASALPVAIGLAAVAAGLALIRSEQIRDSNEALDEYRKQIDESADNSIRLATELKGLNNAEYANGKLTEEQVKQKKKLQSQAKIQIDQLRDQIAAIKELNPATDEQKNAQAAQIKQNERMIAMLEKQAGVTSLQNQAIPELGDAYTQLANKARDAAKQLEEGAGGDPAMFKQQAQELVKVTQKQLELGLITAQQADERLKKVRGDSRLEYDIQLSAQEAITKAYQTETDRRIKISENNISKIDALVAREVISSAEGERRKIAEKRDQLNLQLKATEEAIKREVSMRQEMLNSQIKRVDENIAEQEKRKTEAEAKGDKGAARLAKQELEKLNVEKAGYQESLKANDDKLTGLRNQEEKFRTEQATNEQKDRERVRKLRLEDADEELKILKAKNDSWSITQEDFHKQTMQQEEKYYQEKLKQIKEKRSKLSPKDKEGQEALNVEEAEATKRYYDSVENFEKSKEDVRTKFADSELQKNEERYANNLVQQGDYNKTSLKLTLDKLQVEQDRINRYKSYALEINDKDKLEELAGQEAEINKKRLDAQDKFNQDQLALIDRNQKQSLQIVQESEAKRGIEISQMERDLVIRKVEGDLLRGESSRKTAKEELKIEEDKLQALIDSPLANKSEAARKQREKDIGDLKISIANKTKSLIDDEIAQRERLYRVIEDRLNRQLQQQDNVSKVESQALDRQKLLLDAANKSTEQQNQLLQQRKSLIDSISGYYQNTLSVLKETAQVEFEKDKIGEAAALINLKAVRSKAEIERQVLELNIQQRDNALEQEKIALRMQKIKADADVLKAIAEEKKVAARPDATQEEKDAAAFGTKAAIMNRASLDLQDDVIAQKEQTNKQQADIDRQNQRRSQLEADDKARLELANARVNEVEGFQDKRDLRRDILNREGMQYSYYSGGDIKDLSQRIDFNNVGQTGNTPTRENLNEKLARLEQQTMARLGGVLNPNINLPITKGSVNLATGEIIPQTVLQNQVNTSNMPTNQVAEQTAILEKIKAIGEEKSAKDSSIVFNFNNNFEGKDAENGKAAKTNANSVRQEFKDILLLLGRK